MSVPYYPGITTTPFLNLSLIGMDEVVAQDFIDIDAWAETAGGSSVEINGATVNDPNFNNTTPSAPGGNTNVTWQVDGSGNVSAYVPSSLANVLSVPKAGYTSPTPVYNAQTEAPTGVNPAIYVQDTNGDWHPQAGMDVTTASSAGSGPTVPAGILTWNRIQYFRDSQTPVQGGKNAFLSVNHSAGVGTSYDNQDRALWISMGNITAAIIQFSITSNVVTFVVNNIQSGVAAVGTSPFVINQRIAATGLTTGTYLNNVGLTILTASPITGSNTSAQMTITASDAGFTHADVTLTSDSGSLDLIMYSMANLQMEQDIVGTPNFTGISAPDTEFSVLSLQQSDRHVGAVSSPNLGVNTLRCEYYRERGAGTWGSPLPANIRAILADLDQGTGGAQTLYNILVSSAATAGNADSYVGLYVQSPTGVQRFGGANTGILIDSYGANAADYSLKILGGQISLAGTVTISTLSSVTTWPSTSQNFVLAGPTSGSGASAFRLLVGGDIPAFTGDSGSGGTTGGVPAPSAGDAAAGKYLSAGGTWSVPGGGGGSVAWSSINNAAGSLTLANAAYATTFQQTSNVAWLWQNTTTATSGTTNASPLHEFAANYWNGTTSQQDTWTLGSALAAGTNAASQLTFTHSGGTSGEASVVVPGGSNAVPGFRIGSGLAFASINATTYQLMPGTVSSGGINYNFYQGNGSSYVLAASLTITNAQAGLSLQAAANNNSSQTVGLYGTGGTGAGPAIALGGNGGNNGKDFSATSGSTQVAIDLCGSGAGVGRVTFNPASGAVAFIGARIQPTINQSGSASGSYTALLINPTETSALGTANKLLDAQVGGTSKFALDNSGKIIVPSTNTATSATAGANGAVPNQVVGYLIINVNGTNVKVPYFAV